MILAMVLAIALSSIGASAAQTAPVKNVIVLVGDGMGVAHTTLTRWYKGSPLAMDEMVSGAIKTYCANSMITDSAPAVTAFATGYKSDSKFVSVLPSVIDVPATVEVQEADKFRPVVSVLEAARLIGKSTGIIATSNIQHATPAGYSSHTPNRSDYNDIAEQQVYQNIDVVLGGGKQYLLPAADGGVRGDGENLVNTLKAMGYDFVENTAQMQQSTSKKIWGLFAADAMAYDFDRDPAKEPSLAEMTTKAINTLSKNPNGFFLFVEGSKIDWAAHANDPIGVISDTLAFDASVKVALDYAKTHPGTLVLAFTDHGNGGASTGSFRAGSGGVGGNASATATTSTGDATGTGSASATAIAGSGGVGGTASIGPGLNGNSGAGGNAASNALVISVPNASVSRSRQMASNSTATSSSLN